MNTKTLAFMIAGVAIIAALALSGSGSEDGPHIEVPRPEGPPEDPPAGQNPPVLNGTYAGTEVSPTAPDPSAGEPASLEALYSEFTPGTPSEWPVVRQVKTGDGSLPDWWEPVIGVMLHSHTMAVPPFLSSSCFGESDRKWLERVRASLDAEKARRTQGFGDRIPPVRILDEVTAEYSELLAAVAAKRAGDSPEVQRIFSDTTQLRDMDPRSPRALWLISMVGLVGHRETWRFPDLARREDMQYLCAADLRYLKEMSMALNEIVRGKTPEQMNDPGTISMVRREVEELARLIASRK